MLRRFQRIGPVEREPRPFRRPRPSPGGSSHEACLLLEAISIASLDAARRPRVTPPLPRLYYWKISSKIAGAGWEVQILEAGEILVSRQCATEREAWYVAEAVRKDHLRTGSFAVEKGDAR